MRCHAARIPRRLWPAGRRRVRSSPAGTCCDTGHGRHESCLTVRGNTRPSGHYLKLDQCRLGLRCLAIRRPVNHQHRSGGRGGFSTAGKGPACIWAYFWRLCSCSGADIPLEAALVRGRSAGSAPQAACSTGAFVLVSALASAGICAGTDTKKLWQ